MSRYTDRDPLLLERPIFESGFFAKSNFEKSYILRLFSVITCVLAWGKY